ncbi:MAG TPA: N-acetyltransferase [Patescibacteria group bacterium]|nr:N-acetyltransferase [Patescibacteria group bacterium]
MTTLTSRDAPDAPAWTVRPEEPIDLDQIHDLHRQAFAGPAEAELVDTIRAGAHFIPELSLVAVTDDGSVLGHVLLSRVELQPSADDAPRIPVLALAPIAVLPPHQGRGIGSALMREATDRADRLDEPFTVVLGSPPFYERFGFLPAHSLGLTGPYDAAGDAFRVRPRPGAEVTPGRIVYPPAFSGV